ncbi:MAG: hypothetical protein IPO91_16550 [Chloroflexi bacterium]|nr:hypothetical protein [Chloroflexota bacterium]
MRAACLTLLALLTLTLIAAPAQTAYACSGGYIPYSINRLIQSSTIVKATVIEVDDASKNAILKVESYFTNSNGDEYLLYQLNDPVLSRVYIAYGYDTGCLFDGGGRSGLGETGYYALERNVDGSYHNSDPNLKAPLITLPLDSPQSVYVLTDPLDPVEDYSNLTRVDITSEAQFQDLLAQYNGFNVTPPETFSYRPLKAPLLITTQTGAHFQLPVDYRAPVLIANLTAWAVHPPNSYPEIFDFPPYCAQIRCQLSTPDYSLNAEQVDSSTIAIDFPYSACWDLPTLVGGAFSFSPTSESILVWDRDRLDVYLIESLPIDVHHRLICPETNAPIPHRVFSLSLSGGHIGQVEWSADGNILVYADDQGLWTLDLWRSSQPELVVSGDQLFPLFVSATGRYIGYQTDQASQNWLTLDTVTGETFENALVSNDERQFALLAPTQPAEQRDHFTCTPPLTANCPLVFETFPQEFGWIDRNRYYVVLAPDQNQSGAYAASYSLIENAGRLNEFDFNGFATGDTVMDITYEPHQGTFALLMGDYEIRVNNLSLDLSSSLDGAITQIEWLPPLFYFAE